MEHKTNVEHLQIWSLLCSLISTQQSLKAKTTTTTTTTNKITTCFARKRPLEDPSSWEMNPSWYANDKDVNLAPSCPLTHSRIIPSHARCLLQSPKAHGTSSVPVQDNLRWGCEKDVADRICNFNRYVTTISSLSVLFCFRRSFFLSEQSHSRAVFENPLFG